MATHVNRLTTRMGFTRGTTPERIEKDLVTLFPQERRTMLRYLLIFHGRRVCGAGKPRCEGCVVSDPCPSARR